MKKIQALFIALLFVIPFAKAQITYKTATLIPYVDANNNCVKDAGELLISKSWRFQMYPDNSLNTGFTTNIPAYAQGPNGFYGCGDSLTMSGVCFASPALAAATTSFNLYTWHWEAHLQPCFNPNNIPFNAVTYVPFKSSIIGKEISFAHKMLNCNKGGNYYNVFKGGNVCKTDSVCVFLWAVNASAANCTGTVQCGTGPSTVIVKADGVVIDTYTYNAIYTSLNSYINGANSSLNIGGCNAQNYISSVYINTATVNSFSVGSHTISVTHSPRFGTAQAFTADYEFNITNTCSQISGQAYVDCNNNCMKDGSEAYTYQQISSLTLGNASNNYVIYPNANGNYNFTSIAPGIYTISPTVAANYSLCPFGTNTINIAASSSYGINYGVKQSTITANDYMSYVSMSNGFPGPGAVPGGTCTVNIYNNKVGGNLCLPPVNPGKLKVVLPQLMSYIGVVGNTLPPNSIVAGPLGDTLIWNNPLLVDYHHVSVYTATNAVIGNPYCVKSIIYPLADGDASNNIDMFCHTYGGPYDPNDKKSEATGMAANGDILPNTNEIIYTVRFQNLGNGPAMDVIIRDTLSTNLNIASFEVMQSSFPVSTQINGVSRLATFTFKNIFLQPESVNEPASHGFVRYKIKLNPSLPLGTQIKNRAHIYFDYNSAITTNQVINTIASPTGISEIHETSASLYPNPASGSIFAYSTIAIDGISVVNAIGQPVLLKNCNRQNVVEVNVTELAKGIYFMKIQNINGTSVTKKFIKE